MREIQTPSSEDGAGMISCEYTTQIIYGRSDASGVTRLEMLIRFGAEIAFMIDAELASLDAIAEDERR